MEKIKKILTLGLAMILSLSIVSSPISALTKNRTTVNDNFNYYNTKLWTTGTWSETGTDCPKDINYTFTNALVLNGKLKLNITQNKLYWYKPAKTNVRK